MSEAQSKIIGGKVTFGLTACPKQYESKRVDVEMNFTVKEDDSYEKIFDKACFAAVNRAREMVGLPILRQAQDAESGETKKVATADLFGG